MNDIIKNQNEEKMIRLLRARARTTDLAKLLLALSITLFSIAPVVTVLCVYKYPDSRPWFVLVALFFVLIDIGWIERYQKHLLKLNAKLQEMFDTELLSIPWNEFVAGRRVDHEYVAKKSNTRLSDRREKQLKNWYPDAVSKVQKDMAAIICQRTNIAYDVTLRERYANSLIAIILVASFILVLIAFYNDMKVHDVVLTVIAPALPLLAWGLRESMRHKDTAKTLLDYKVEVEKMWDDLKTENNSAVIQQRSRQLQDAIFRHRASSPLIFNWVYQLMRDGNEHSAKLVADALVKEISTVQPGSQQ